MAVNSISQQQNKQTTGRQTQQAIIDLTHAMDVEEDDDEEEFEEKPFQVKVSDEDVLTGQVNKAGHIEWEWARVAAALKFETQKDGLFSRGAWKCFKLNFEKHSFPLMNSTIEGQMPHKAKLESTVWNQEPLF